MKKRILAIWFCVMLVAVCTACGSKNNWVFSLNDEKLYDIDVKVFGLIYVTEYNIKDNEQLKEEYIDGKTYQEFYLNDLKEVIIKDVLLYKDAMKNRHSLTSEEKEQVETNTKALVEACGKQWLSANDITESDIRKIYEMKAIAESYINTISKVELEEEEEIRYVEVYQVLFPTVEFDEDGMVRTNQDGTLVMVSAGEASEMKELANEFVTKVSEGKEPENLAKDYQSKGVSGTNLSLKYNDLEDSYKNAIAGLGEGKTSGVIESDYGYYVVKLLNKDATEFEDTINQHDAETLGNQERDELYKRLYDTYVGNGQEYINQDKWEKITMASFLYR